MPVSTHITNVIYRGYDILWSDAKQAYEIHAEGKPCDGDGGSWTNVERAYDAIDSRRRSRVAAGLGAVG